MRPFVCLTNFTAEQQQGEEYTGALLGVNYLAAMECSMFPRLAGILWLCVLLLFLMSTADEYLTGTLSIICDLLKMSQQVAGATLLALGNGAPDIFSILAAFTKGTTSHTDLGLGELVGSSTFVLTMILGLVIVLQQPAGTATGQPHDDISYIQVRWETFGRDVWFVVLAFSMLLLLHLTNVGATILVGLCFITVYVAYVATVLYQSRRMYDTTTATTARPPTEVVVVVVVDKQEAAMSDSDDDDDEAVMLIASKRRRPNQSPPLTTATSVTIIEDHFQLPPPSTTTTTTTNNNNPSSPPPPPPRRPCIGGCGNTLRGVYWSQLRARHQAARYGKAHVAQLWEMNSVLAMIKLLCWPLEIARALTVPVPEPESWNRTLIAMHAPGCLMFVGYLFPRLVAPNAAVFAVLCVLAGALSLAAHFSLHSSTAPRSRTIRLGLAWVAFAMCVLWIYVTASEIVCLLNTFGAVWEVHPSILGLSIMAWGNSIGDLITNVAIARSGMSEMAVSACIAAPVFQLLFGFGVSLVAVAAKYTPAAVPIRLDRFTLPVVLLVVCVMLTSLLFARLAQYRLRKPLGVFLCTAYIGYLVGMVIVR